MASSKKTNTLVQIRRTTITDCPATAIVSPTSSTGEMSSEVCKSIKELGGEAVEAQAQKIAPIAVGAALITEAGDLPAKHVIHTPVSIRPADLVETDNVRRAARAALVAAQMNQFESIAIPGLGWGDPVVVHDSARAVVEEVKAHNKSFPKEVFLVAPSEELATAFEDALANVQRNV